MHPFTTCLAACSIAVATSLASLASGCATTPDQELGTVEIPLQQRGPDGALYHLSATFQVSGPGGSQVVDGNGDSPSVTLSLPPGITTVELLAGWTLARSFDEGATFTPVSALLGTQNPFTLRVLANFSDTVVFQFLVRDPAGQVTISFGVTVQPRGLLGGMIINAGTGAFAGYAGRRLDYAIFHNLAEVEHVNLADGSKDLVFHAGASATEFFNDPLGLLAGAIGPSLTGALLNYDIAARPDGTQVLTGELDGLNDPFATLTFGPYTFQFGNLPLDADGFPTDVFFQESPVLFTLTAFFPTGDATISGELRFRSVPATN